MGMPRASFEISPRLWAGLTLPVATVCLIGCLPPPQMRLSEASRQSALKGVWWCVPSTTALGSPIVAVEQARSKTRVRQWLIDDRGVRCFDYRGAQASAWGPPRSSRAGGDGFAVVRSLARARFGAADEPGWPGPPLPADEVDRLAGTADLVALLRRQWGDHETSPPPDLTPHAIEQAMEAAEITGGSLLKSGM